MKRLIPILPCLGGLLLIAVALLCLEPDLLWKVQQYNLFLDTSLFFSERMLVPGGFLSYVSCFFTQFFYYPWLGVLMLCCWWLLLMWLTKRAFRISGNWTIPLLIPVAILLAADMSLGYWHYFMRLRGYFFVPTIGTTAGVTMLWAFRALPQKLWLRIVYIFVATAVGYPLFGIYALAAVLLMGIWTWRLASNRTQNIILSAVALLCVIAVPLVCYRYIYYQTNYDDLWTAALPISHDLKNDHAHYIPYYILGGFFLLMVVCYGRAVPSIIQKPLYRWGVQGVLAVALIAGVWHWWCKDENFHHELVMQHCIETLDWEGVLNEGNKQTVEPTRSIMMMRNLALSRLGRSDEMFNFPWGRIKGGTDVPYDILSQVFSRTIYYNYGLLNDSHRRSMEEGVEYGWRVESLQYMARNSILSRERKAALKALNQLRHTMFYGEWADSLQQLADYPKRKAQDPEMGPITHMLKYKNLMGFDEGNVEKYVLNVLAYQDSNDPYFQEQAVIAALLKRNPKLFWARFSRYAQLSPNGPIPRIFQEAAILFGGMEGSPALGKIPFDKGVVDNYTAFMKESYKYKGSSKDIVRTALYPFFGNTYFFYFYFLDDTK